MNTGTGNPLSGSGFVFEIYKDYVLIRARNYTFSSRLKAYGTKIELV